MRSWPIAQTKHDLEAHLPMVVKVVTIPLGDKALCQEVKGVTIPLGDKD